MARTIHPVFDLNPQASQIVGRLISGYGELEFEFGLCLGRALGDYEMAARALYRMKGEDSRLTVADALMRPYFTRIGLKDPYETMIGSMRACKSIRNQYAHCHWIHTSAGMFFTDFDKAVKTSTGNVMLTFNHVDVELLTLQEAYFVAAGDWLLYLQDEHDRMAEKPSTPPLKAPPTLDAPPLHNPRELHPLPPRLADADRLKGPPRITAKP